MRIAILGSGPAAFGVAIELFEKKKSFKLFAGPEKNWDINLFSKYFADYSCESKKWIDQNISKIENLKNEKLISFEEFVRVSAHFEDPSIVNIITMADEQKNLENYEMFSDIVDLNWKSFKDKEFLQKNGGVVFNARFYKGTKIKTFKEVLKSWNEIIKLKKITLSGDTNQSAMLLCLLIEEMKKRDDLKVNLITQSKKAFSDIEGELKNRLETSLQFIREEMSRKTKDFEERTRQYRNIEFSKRQTMSAPIEPEFRLQKFEQSSPLSVEAFDDRDGLFLTINWQDNIKCFETEMIISCEESAANFELCVYQNNQEIMDVPKLSAEIYDFINKKEESNCESTL